MIYAHQQKLLEDINHKLKFINKKHGIIFVY